MALIEDRPVEASLDQSRDAVALQALLDTTEMTISKADREVLRRLAGEVADLAARPIEDKKRELWCRHNALEPTRPLIFCDPEYGWNEIITADQIACQGTLARQWAMHLRKERFWGMEMGDDYTIEPYFEIPYVHADIDWGLRETRIGGEDGGAFRWESPVTSEADLENLHLPEIRIDYGATHRLAELAEEIFGDLLTVRIKTLWWWSLGMTRTLVELRGLQQIMFDMIDNPDLVHRLMTILRDGTLAMLDFLEEGGLLSRNDDGTYVGSGGVGWSEELPQPDFDSKVRCCDMWGFSESQETVGISPEMFAEFVFPYQLPILERFGLNCYGCCEPLDKRWHVVEQIPNLRRVSVSYWASWAEMAEMLGDGYILSLKPSPTDLAMDTFDEQLIRTKLREALQITRECRVEVIMKDNHTIRNDPTRVVRWVQIAREEAENL
jgi:hypothetical protein